MDSYFGLVRPHQQGIAKIPGAPSLWHFNVRNVVELGWERKNRERQYKRCSCEINIVKEDHAVTAI